MIVVRHERDPNCSCIFSRSAFKNGFVYLNLDRMMMNVVQAHTCSYVSEVGVIVTYGTKVLGIWLWND